VRASLAVAMIAALVLSACAQAGPESAVAVPVASRAVSVTTAPAAGFGPATAAERACLAEAIYFEAGQSREGFEAVGHVVVNRARDPRFPRTVCGVVGERCQFSYRCEGKSLALANPDRSTRAQRIAEAVLAGAPDPTRGALFFHAASVAPGWFASRARVGEFGGNVFYR
jgi:N-acetylmuramoyl-L-alanine amidase